MWLWGIPYAYRESQSLASSHSHFLVPCAAIDDKRMGYTLTLMPLKEIQSPLLTFREV